MPRILFVFCCFLCRCFLYWMKEKCYPFFTVIRIIPGSRDTGQKVKNGEWKNMRTVKKQRNTVLSAAFIMMLLLTACAGGKNATAGEEQEAEVKQLPQISIVEAGREYDVNDVCKVFETYGQYNIQVPVEQLAAEFLTEGAEGLEIKSHSVILADDTTAENGKYDVIDTIEVVVQGADPFAVLPQRIEKTVEYKRDAISSEWVLTKTLSTNWTVNNRKFGGTAWKISTENGDAYLRLRDTFEYFYVSGIVASDYAEQVQFYATINGVIGTTTDGELMLERIVVQEGSLTEKGELILKIATEENLEDVREIILKEKIEKTELPFTEEEYKAVMDV